jgi:integrase/recombinase XerD
MTRLRLENVDRRRRRLKKKRPELGESDDPLALSPLVRAYLDALEVRGFSPHTIKNLEHNLFCFLVWCEERALTRVSDITRPMILRYQRWVFHYRTTQDKPLGIRGQQHRLQAVIGLFRWLTRENYLMYNPATEIDLPRGEKRLPSRILSADEADRVMNQPDLTDALGVRDRAILEVLYSTGLRRMELCNLGVFDIDLERGTLRVEQGKGKKDRMIPIGERAVAWVEKYLTEVRPRLIIEPDHGTLFVTHIGEQMGLNTMSQTVKDYVRAAGISSGSCHIFRHSMATLMLENGADIRWIQAMLGHENIQSTELYTHISIRKLKEIHTLTHPAAKMKKREEEDVDPVAAESSDDVEIDREESVH